MLLTLQLVIVRGVHMRLRHFSPSSKPAYDLVRDGGPAPRITRPRATAGSEPSRLSVTERPIGSSIPGYGRGSVQADVPPACIRPASGPVRSWKDGWLLRYLDWRRDSSSSLSESIWMSPAPDCVRAQRPGDYVAAASPITFCTLPTTDYGMIS